MKKVPPGEAAHFFSARMTPKSSHQCLEMVMRRRICSMEEVGRELAFIANLCAGRSRFRARRGRLAIHG
jgi:hypothetical protein